MEDYAGFGGGGAEGEIVDLDLVYGFIRLCRCLERGGRGGAYPTMDPS